MVLVSNWDYETAFSETLGERCRLSHAGEVLGGVRAYGLRYCFCEHRQLGGGYGHPEDGEQCEFELVYAQGREREITEVEEAA